ncbi:MAG: ThuA domain-containing protein [Chloroflexi bacterium]|nr:ThuA domain-containing protein [Chloroflexota bacterium]
MIDQPQALLLAGDRYHDAGIAFTGIGDLLEAEGIAVQRTTDFAALDADALDGKSLLIILRDGIEWPEGPNGPRVVWMQPHQERAIEEFVLQGGAFLALHNAGWAYPYQGGYRRTLGGYYIGHPPIARFRVEVINHTHPVTRGVESYEIVDEQHWLHWDFDRVTPLLLSQGLGEDGRQSISGWAYEYGRGRVVYLPHGHTLEALQHPMNQRLVRNAARWLLRMAE